MPPLLSSLSRHHPDVRTTIVEGATSSLLLRLANGEIDAAIVHLPIADTTLDVRELFAEELFLVAPTQHVLAKHTSITLEELAEHPIMLAPRGTAQRRIVDRAAANHGVALQSLAEIDGVRLMASLVFEGFGAAIVPASAVPGWLQGNFVRIPIEEMPRRVVGWVQRPRPRPNRATLAVRERAIDTVQRHAPRQPGITLEIGVKPAKGPLYGVSATDINTFDVVVELQHSVPGAASAAVVRFAHGREAVWLTVDGEVHKGALSAAASHVIATAAQTARSKGLPLVTQMESSGADILEGIAALHGWGTAAKALADCSGVVPTISIVTGPAVSGPALLIGLSDFVVMTDDSYAFVSGPTMVAEFTGIEVSTDELGGAGTHARHSGASSVVVPDVAGAIAWVEELLEFLPSSVDQLAPITETDDADDRLTPEAGALIPELSTGSYDVRDVIASIVDDGHYMEIRARWAGNVITAFANMAGYSIGIVANQPISLAGTLDIPASQKAARFVSFCDAFNIPVLTLVDTPGFYPGKDLEWRGMIRHGAQLVFAYARATVPRICVILRKSYGGAYIVMDSKEMGNDLCLAWPWAELAVMGAGQAAAILQRRATDEERAAFEADYSQRLLNPYIAAERGYVDAVIDPADTRREICAALHMLRDKREKLVSRKHDNTPL
jgi:acetyl-CoA carboxylase carboxyltransferase component